MQDLTIHLSSNDICIGLICLFIIILVILFLYKEEDYRIEDERLNDALEENRKLMHEIDQIELQLRRKINESNRRKNKQK